MGTILSLQNPYGHVFNIKVTLKLYRKEKGLECVGGIVESVLGAEYESEQPYEKSGEIRSKKYPETHKIEFLYARFSLYPSNLKKLMGFNLEAL